MIMESEQRRREMSHVYNSYTAARSKYSIEDIPMPDASEGETVTWQLGGVSVFTCGEDKDYACVSVCYSCRWP